MKLRKSFSLLMGSALLAVGAGLAAGWGARARAAANPQSPAVPVPVQAASAKGADGQAGAESLPMPVDEIIRRFAQHESDFKIARDNYTYTQDVLVEDVAPNHGEYRVTTDVVFTPEGRRYDHDTYDPAPTLVDFDLSPEDKQDLENIQPFVLTTEDIPKYDVQYVGREKVDDLGTYVFRVAPKKMEKGRRYFQGTIWVDDQDFAVVKSDGKAVPDLKNNLFPRFITYRENIEGTFWFPTYTHADDVLHFGNGDVHIRMTVRYKNYKRFGSTVRLGESKTIAAPPDSQAPPQK